MKKTERPLSPHLQIYKPQLTSVLSIAHRITGFGLSVMGCLVVAWLFAAACGPDTYKCFMTYASHPLGKAIGFLGVYAFFYHLLNGLRHLGWDMTWGLDLKSTYVTGWSVVCLSVALSILYYICF